MQKKLLHIYDSLGFKVLDFINEKESRDYNPCRFHLNGLHIVCRNAKITPKKVGQFVTFWKRNALGVSVPLNDSDSIDYYVINVNKDNDCGQFIIPKIVLIKNGIMSSNNSSGKRGFRLYPPWDITTNKQAKKTQQWQSKFFININKQTDIVLFKYLYGQS